MALTRTQLVARVLDSMGRSGTGTSRSGVAYSTLAIDWLNFAQYRIARRYDFLFRTSTASTIASQKCYAMPSAVKTIYGITLQNGSSSRKLTMVLQEDFDLYIPYPENATTGTPNWYVPHKTTNEFDLYRIPDAAYTLQMRFTYWPTELTSDAQTSDFSHMDDVLIAGAVHEGYLFIQELGDATLWEGIYTKRLQEAYDSFNDYPDWYVQSKGFSSTPMSYGVGEYYADPLVFQQPRYTWQ